MQFDSFSIKLKLFLVMEFWSLQTLLANDATQSFLDFLKDCNALRHKGTLEVRECSLFAHAQMSLCTDMGTERGPGVN